MARIATITVEFHGDPELPADLAQQMLDEVIDAANGIGYVSDVEWQDDRTEAESAERIAAGVRDGNLSWGDVADQSARGWCPASPEGNEPHKVTDDATCDECGANAEDDVPGWVLSDPDSQAEYRAKYGV